MAVRNIKRNIVLISRKIKAARIYSFGTVTELANASGLSTQAVVSAEHQEHNSTITTIMRICEATGMPISWLVDDSCVLSAEWEQVTTAHRVTRNTRIPDDPPWKDYALASTSFTLEPHHLKRLKILSRLLGISTDSLLYQLVNEGLAIKEAQFETVTDKTLDVELLREVLEIYEQIEMDEVRELSPDEKNKVVKSIYFELEAKGISAKALSLSDIVRLVS